MDKDCYRYASRIKAERSNKKMSQRSLAEMIGMDNTYLSRIENGDRDITVSNLVKIADALNVSIDYLLLDFIDENVYCDSERIWKQINKLNAAQKETLINIIMILTQNSEQWGDNDKENPVPNGNDRYADYTEIGRRIRSRRRKKQLSQEKLAELAGISTGFLGSIERGEEILSIETLYRLSNALDAPVAEFLMNANRINLALGLHDAVEGLMQSKDSKSSLILNLLAVLSDNSDKL